MIMSDSKYTDYFGFDLGDGESAVAWMRAGKRTEPQLIELRGRKSVITALASHSEKGMFIGEEACHLSGADWLQVRFKSRFLTDRAASSGLIQMFAREVLSILLADGRLENPGDACFFIGCPSGWDQDTRDAYKNLFVRAGMVNCEIVSESRAAFMFARESGELRVSDELLTLPTLIIDAGSSTTDFTFVADLAEKPLIASDFGEVHLGGGLIDRLLLERNLSRSPVRRELESVFERFPQYETRCEFEARRMKEMYCTHARRGDDMRAESAVKIYSGRTPLTFDISCDGTDLAAVLSQPVPELKGQSFEGSFRASLDAAKTELGEDTPQIILLTGGASRMPLIEDAARAVFPDAQVLRGLEPEFAIARGLCYALRIDQATMGFHQAVQSLIASDEMENLVLSRLPLLFNAVSIPLTDRLVDEIAPDVFALWRSGGLKTFNDIGSELSVRAEALMKSDDMKEALRPAVSEWVMRLRPDIEAMTDPICDQYGLPRTSLRLPESLDIGAAQIMLGSGDLIEISQFKALIDLIVATVMASIFGGGGIALIATGVPGLVGGFILGLAAGIIGTEAAEKLLAKAELPVAARKLLTTGFFRRSLARRKEDIRSGILTEFNKHLDPPSEAAMGMVSSIASSIEDQLTRMMERAALMIH